MGGLCGPIQEGWCRFFAGPEYPGRDPIHPSQLPEGEGRNVLHQLGLKGPCSPRPHPWGRSLGPEGSRVWRLMLVDQAAGCDLTPKE